MGISLLAIVLAGQAANITYMTRAVPVSRMVAALADESKQPMRADGPIANDIVVASFKGQPLQTIMDRLADAVLGTWTNENGTYVLARDNGKVRLRDQADIKRRATGIAKEIAERTKALPNAQVDYSKVVGELRTLYQALEQNNGTADEKAYERLAQLQSQLPTGALIPRLVGTFDPLALAALPIGQRVVYAITPTRMQKSLPPAAQNIARQFAAEMSKFNSFFKGSADEEAMAFAGAFGLASSDRPVAEMLLSITRDGLRLSIEVAVLDEKGALVSQQSDGFGSFMEEVEAAKPAAAKPRSDQLKLSEEAKTVQALFNNSFESEKAGIDLCPAPLREKLLNPEQNDPLGFGASEMLLGIAGEAPFVCEVPDAMLAAGGLDNAGAEAIKDLLKKQGLIDLAEKEGWVLGTSFNWADTKATMTPRASLGNYLRKVAQKRMVSLDDFAAYARTAPIHSSYDSVFLQLNQGLFAPWLAGANLYDLSAARFYATLPSATRNQLQNGLRISALGGESIQALASYVYRQSSLETNYLIQEESGDANDVSVALNMSEKWLDPTEALPAGVPPDSIVKMTVTVDDVVVPIGSYPQPLSAEDLASQTAMQERPDLFPWTSEIRLPSTFRMSKRSMISIQTQFNRETMCSISLTDLVNGDGKSYTRKDLPASFRESYESQLKQVRESYKGMKAEPGVRTGPPPP